LEDFAVIVAAVLATLHAEWRIISNPYVFQADAEIHEFWMRRFQDSELFRDPLTKALLDTGYEPPVFQFIYWLASHVIDPVLFGELLPLVLQPLCVWLVFRIVRQHSTWWPAAWIGAALFLVPWEINRFSGGHPRAFAQPIVLLTLFFLLRRRNAVAAIVPPVGALLYPPAGLVALAVMVLGALARRKRFSIDRGRAVSAAVAVVAFGAVTLTTRIVTGSQDLISADEARRYPEFGPGGPMHFWGGSTLEFLRQNYSGFNLRDSGSILAVTALALLLLRPRNALLLRWEVWCLPLASLTLFGAAHALLFRLYLPHRYTYALLPFFCILIGVSLKPTIEAYAARARALLVLSPVLPLVLAAVALVLFPLGPLESRSRLENWFESAAAYLLLGLVVALVVAGILVRRSLPLGAGAATVVAALVVGCLLVAEVSFASGTTSPGISSCKYRGLYQYLETLPPDAVVAGDPWALSCVPIAARRPVLISRKLYQPWERRYFALIRPRMFATFEALYGPSRDAIVALRSRYGADYLLVPRPLRGRPPPMMAPFTSQVRRLQRTVAVPAVTELRSTCETYKSDKFAIYDLSCLSEESPG
jgi:hypothetical protein